MSMTAETVTIPKVEEVTFGGALNGTLEQALARISQIPFYSIKLEDGKLVAARIESRNINKKPYLFYMIEISKDSIGAIYSIPPDTSDRMRRAYVIKDMISMLSILSGIFKIDETRFYQYVDSVVDDLLKGLSDNYSSLFNKYDSQLSEYRELKRLNLELSAANRNLTVQTSQLNEENKKLKEDLTALQKYSDQALMNMVMDWIEVHNSTIDVGEFAKTYNIVQPRVEQILDKMVSQGYLELKE